MKKLSILKKEIYYNLGFGISNLVIGMMSYIHLPKRISEIILILCFAAILSALVPFFRNTDPDDELSAKIRNEACVITLRIGLLILIALSIPVKFTPVCSAVMKDGLISLIAAFFFLFYCVVFTVLSKKYEISDNDFIEE